MNTEMRLSSVDPDSIGRVECAQILTRHASIWEDYYNGGISAVKRDEALAPGRIRIYAIRSKREHLATHHFRKEAEEEYARFKEDLKERRKKHAAPSKSQQGLPPINKSRWNPFY